MKVKTEQLRDTALDWAVAKAIKANFIVQRSALTDATQVYLLSGDDRVESMFCPSTHWSQGGPIIEQAGIALRPHEHDVQKWSAEQPLRGIGERLSSFRTGPTPLIAAMRCFVASRLGDEVDAPQELLA